MNEIFNRHYDVTNMENNSIVCSNWSQIYADLLNEAGVSPDKVKVCGGGHKYVTVDLGKGKILIADATNGILTDADLTNSKMGNKTFGFIITTQEEFDSVFSQMQGDHRFYQTEIELAMNPSPELDKIDKNIGYTKHRENLKKIISQYIENATSFEDKVNAFCDIFNDKTSSVRDSFGLMQSYADSIFGEDTDSWYHTMGSKGMIAIVQAEDANGERVYLYKVNDSPIQVTEDYSDINKYLI